jgi:Flp pilus assembly protein TadB
VTTGDAARQPGEEAGPPRPEVPQRPSAGQTLAAMWLYTLLRFGMFLLLWALLWLARVPGLLAAMIALVLSVPLSYVLLRRQRDRVAANLQQRVTARQAQRQDLDAKLSGEDPVP